MLVSKEPKLPLLEQSCFLGVLRRIPEGPFLAAVGRLVSKNKAFVHILALSRSRNISKTKSTCTPRLFRVLKIYC